MSEIGKRNIDKMLMEMFPSDPEIAECFIGILNVISVTVPPKGEPLIHGYTAEQWEEIILGGYLCEFWGGDYSENHVRAGLLEELTGTQHPFDGADSSWSHCRPAQIKGVMRPIFVEPVDNDSVRFLFFDKSGSIVGETNNFRLHLESHPSTCATKYIEV